MAVNIHGNYKQLLTTSKKCKLRNCEKLTKHCFNFSKEVSKDYMSFGCLVVELSLILLNLIICRFHICEFVPVLKFYLKPPHQQLGAFT